MTVARPVATPGRTPATRVPADRWGRCSRTLLACLSLLGLAGPAAADPCQLRIEANDRIQYDRAELVIPAGCDAVSVTLVHTGRLPVEQMGHNWVLTRGAHYKRVAQAGMRAGPENDYLVAGDDRVIAATRVIGGGERASVSFDASRLEPGGDYIFFCSFPGHYGVMNGRLVVR